MNFENKSTITQRYIATHDQTLYEEEVEGMHNAKFSPKGHLTKSIIRQFGISKLNLVYYRT